MATLTENIRKTDVFKNNFKKYTSELSKSFKDNAEMLNTMDELLQVNEEISNANEFFFEQINQLKTIHNNILSGLFDKRQRILDSKNERNMKKETNAVNPNNLNTYWFQSMSNNKVISELICPEDEVLLGYINNIKYSKSNLIGDDKEKNSISLIVEFNENPFIENKELVKTIIYDDNTNTSIKSIISSEINWKKNKNYTIFKEQKTLLNKKTGETKKIEITSNKKSFLNYFFTIVDILETNKTALNSTDHDSEFELINLINQENKILREFCFSLIPYSVEYFIGFKHLESKLKIRDYFFNLN